MCIICHWKGNLDGFSNLALDAFTISSCTTNVAIPTEKTFLKLLDNIRYDAFLIEIFIVLCLRYASYVPRESFDSPMIPT